MNAIRILDTIDRLESEIERLQSDISSARFNLELLYLKLSNGTVKYSKSLTEQELLSDPRFPSLLGRLYSTIY
jgi:hypothetical protein